MQFFASPSLHTLIVMFRVCQIVDKKCAVVVPISDFYLVLGHFSLGIRLTGWYNAFRERQVFDKNDVSLARPS